MRQAGKAGREPEMPTRHEGGRAIAPPSSPAALVAILQRAAGNRATVAALTARRVLAREPDVLHDRAMFQAESRLRSFYRRLSRPDRIDLKANGTIAIGVVTKKDDPDAPYLVYTTADNKASRAIQDVADELGLTRWEGDPGLWKDPPAGNTLPPGEGGVVHAEQIMIEQAKRGGWIVRGIAVSRKLCHDCRLVLTGYNGGRIKISVLPDPDESLPNPRDARWQQKSQAPDDPPNDVGKPPKRVVKPSKAADEPTGGWDATAGPPQPGRKGPNFKPQPQDTVPKTPPKPVPVKPNVEPDIEPPSLPGAGGRSIRGIGASVAALGFAQLAAFFASWARQRWNEQRMKAAWEKLEPTIKDAVDRLDPQAQALVERTNGGENVYVNIYVDYVERQEAISTGELDDWPSRDFHELNFLRAEVSTNNLKKELPTSTYEKIYNTIYWHNHLVYSVKVYDPEVALWEEMLDYERTHGGPPDMGPMWRRAKDPRKPEDELQWDRYKGRWVQKKR